MLSLLLDHLEVLFSHVLCSLESGLDVFSPGPDLIIELLSGVRNRFVYLLIVLLGLDGCVLPPFYGLLRELVSLLKLLLDLLLLFFLLLLLFLQGLVQLLGVLLGGLDYQINGLLSEFLSSLKLLLGFLGLGLKLMSLSLDHKLARVFLSSCYFGLQDFVSLLLSSVKLLGHVISDLSELFGLSSGFSPSDLNHFVLIVPLPGQLLLPEFLSSHELLFDIFKLYWSSLGILQLLRDLRYDLCWRLLELDVKCDWLY